MKHICILAVAAMVAANGAFAQATSPVPEKDPHAAHRAADRKQAGTYTEGEVRKVDRVAGKITLKHGPIANLDMPAMSMVFRAKDPAMLDRVEVGSKVRFKADNVGGVLTVTEMQIAR